MGTVYLEIKNLTTSWGYESLSVVRIFWFDLTHNFLCKGKWQLVESCGWLCNVFSWCPLCYISVDSYIFFFFFLSTQDFKQQQNSRIKKWLVLWTVYIGKIVSINMIMFSISKFWTWDPESTVLFALCFSGCVKIMSTHAVWCRHRIAVLKATANWNVDLDVKMTPIVSGRNNSSLELLEVGFEPSSISCSLG